MDYDNPFVSFWSLAKFILALFISFHVNPTFFSLFEPYEYTHMDVGNESCSSGQPNSVIGWVLNTNN